MSDKKRHGMTRAEKRQLANRRTNTFMEAMALHRKNPSQHPAPKVGGKAPRVGGGNASLSAKYRW